MNKFLFIICMIATSVSFANKWDSTYISNLITSGGFDKVIDYYKDKYAGKNRNKQDAITIAELYVKKKEYSNAILWYEKEKQLLYSSKEILFNYGNTYRLAGDYQKALDAYLMYSTNTGDVNRVLDFTNQCERLLKLSFQTSNYTLDNYTYNTADDEINAAQLRTNAVYNTLKNTKNKGEKQTPNFNQVVRNFDLFTTPIKAYKNNIPNLIITSLSYTKDGNTVVFSAKEEISSAINKEKIYTAENLAGNFLNVKPLSFNKDNYSYKNPSFNDNGTTIYFSSNQIGGFGGFDIWETSLEKGEWITPINLGRLANSTADEINPFLVQDGNDNTLYFSSNRENGFGGFDIFSVKKSNNIWQDVAIQPAPINSSSDDIGIIYDNEVKTGYFSSNRIGGKGGFDLYRFTPFKLNIIINTIDAKTNKPVDFVFTQLMENGSQITEGITDNAGKICFQVAKDKSFKISVAKDNYQSVIINTNTIGKKNGDSIKINIAIKKDTTNSLSTDNYIIFTGHIIDSSTQKPATTAKMQMINFATKKIRELDIDKDGKFEIKLLLNNYYKIIFEKNSTKKIDEISTYGLKKMEVKIRNFVF